MTTPASGDPADVDTLKAYLTALEGKPEEALAQLAGKEDPESLLRRLSILLDLERFDEAAALIRDRPPHDRWCERAVAALAVVGEFEAATRIVSWAHRQTDHLLWPSCLVALARHRYLHAFRDWPKNGKGILPGELNADQAAGARQALADLTPIVSAVKVQRRILTGVEADAVCLAMEFSYLLEARDEYRELADLVWERNPLPLTYAYAVLRRAVPPNPELPERLRRERGDSFEAKRLAAFIEGTLLDKPAEAVQAVEKLIPEYRSPDQQQQLAHLLLELAPHLAAESRPDVERRAAEMLGPESRYAKLRAIDEHIHHDRHDEAFALLEKLPEQDDPALLERLAAIRAGQGQPGQAVDLLIRATETHPEPGLLRKAAVLAGQNGRTADAIRLLERFLHAEPDDLPVRNRLATLYGERGEYEKAAVQFHALRKLNPVEPAFGINEAVSLALAMRAEESLRVYDELCAGDSPPVAAVVGRAMLLKGMNRAEDGFRSLEPYRTTFWHHPAFLTAYMDLGYASKREREAQQGFLRLHQLQTEGVIEKVLHEAKIDDILRMMREYAKNEEHLNAGILKGQFPWLLAAQLLNHTAMTGFRIRTCPLSWASEEPLVWARHSLYATNSFVVTGEGASRKWVEPIRAPERGQKVVVDLSALITLSRLELLPAVVDYFGECYFPSSYRSAALRERGRLVAHQPSQPEAARGVKAAIEAKQVVRVASGAGMPFVHEHCPDTDADEQHVYGFVDLIPPLEAAELVTDAKLRELKGLARRPSGAGGEHAKLALGDAVCIDHSGLETLQQHGLLAPVASVLKVHITEGDIAALDGKITEGEERQRLWEWHTALWEAVKGEPRLVAAGHSTPEPFAEAKNKEPTDDAGDEERWLPLHSAFLAGEKRFPLLVDDRCCQMFVHNDRRSATAAFGSDAVLAALLDAALLTADQAADAYLRLIGWRYRFVVVPPAALVALAKRNTATPPGQPLRQVAKYVQDCMRDPGLFGGLEPTAPPVAMAHKLFLTWTTTLTEFVVAVWEDKTIPAGSAQTLTEWALTECLPAAPATIQGNSWVLEQQQPRALLAQAFVRAASRRETERVNRALVAIATVLGLSEREYLAVLAEVVDAL